MGYYTIWLAPVKKFFCPVLGIGEEKTQIIDPGKFKTRNLKIEGCGTRRSGVDKVFAL